MAKVLVDFTFQYGSIKSNYDNGMYICKGLYIPVWFY